MNYYQLLGVRPTASRDEIRAAYLRLAQEVHPDRHIGKADDEVEGSDRVKFNRIQEAYEVLYDPKARTAYDLKHGAIPQPRHDGSQRTHRPSAAQHAAHVHSSSRRASSGYAGGGAKKRSILQYAILAVLLGLIVTAVPRCGVLLNEMRSNLEDELSNAIPSGEGTREDDSDSRILEDVDYVGLVEEAGLVEEQLPEYESEGTQSKESENDTDSSRLVGIDPSSDAASVLDRAKQALEEGGGNGYIDFQYSEESESFIVPIETFAPTTTERWNAHTASMDESEFLSPNDSKFQTNHLLQQHKSRVDHIAIPPPGIASHGSLSPSGLLGGNGPDEIYTGTNRYGNLKLDPIPRNTNSHYSSFGSSNYGGSDAGIRSGLGNYEPQAPAGSNPQRNNYGGLDRYLPGSSNGNGADAGGGFPPIPGGRVPGSGKRSSFGSGRAYDSLPSIP